MMVDSSDHITGKTGLTPTVTLSKNLAAFASPAGAVTEVANGWYKVAANATDTNTLGSLILHATGSGADPCDVFNEVVAFDPDDTVRLGLTALPNAAAAAAGGLIILGSNNTAAITIGALTTGAISGTTLTFSGAVAFQSTFAVTTSTALGALSCSTFAASGTVTYNAFTITNNFLVSGTTTLTGNTTFTGAVNSINASNDIRVNGVAAGGAGGLLISGSNLGTTTFGALTVTGATTLAALSMTTLTTSGAVSFGSTFTITTNLLVSGTTTLTGAVTASNASNNIVGIDVAKISGDATAADNAELFFDGTGYAGGTIKLAVNVAQMGGVTVTANAGTNFQFFFNDTGATASAILDNITDSLSTIGSLDGRLPSALTGAGNMKSDMLAISNDTTAADNAEAWFDGTGYVNNNNSIGTVALVNSLSNNSITAAVLSSDAGDEIATAVWALATRTITGGTIGTITGLTISGLENMQSRWAGMTVLDGAVYQYTANALELAPSGGGGSAQAVWDLATSLIVTPGSIGAFVLALNAGSGSGAFTVTVTVSNVASPFGILQNALVRLIEVGNPSNDFTAVTSSSGIATFAINAATYNITITKDGWQFTIPATIVVSGSANFNKTMAAVAIPPAPANPSQCTVYAYLLNMDGTAASGVVVNAQLDTGDESVIPTSGGGSIFVPTVVSATSDGSGYMEMDLFQNAMIEPDDTLWNISAPQANFFRSVTLSTSTLNLNTTL